MNREIKWPYRLLKWQNKLMADINNADVTLVDDSFVIENLDHNMNDLLPNGTFRTKVR